MMAGIKRKALLAAFAGVCGVAAAVPMIMSGVASAQTNSRLCGVYWVSPRTGEVVTRIYEVRKGDGLVCGKASSEEKSPGDAASPRDAPFKDKIRDREKFPGLGTFQDWRHDSFRQVKCEAWDTRGLEVGGLGGKLINFIGDNWPPGNKDQFDICNNMNRSDAIGDMEQYWLYWNADPNNATVDFQRA